jgi:hypothetical protein
MAFCLSGPRFKRNQISLNRLHFQPTTPCAEGNQLENGEYHRSSIGSYDWQLLQPFRSDLCDLPPRCSYFIGLRQLLVLDTMIDLGTHIWNNSQMPPLKSLVYSPQNNDMHRSRTGRVGSLRSARLIPAR